jgi:hypothetical protein
MSQQNSQTPRELIEAIERYFDVKFVFDIACTTFDKVTPNGYYFDEGVNALEQDWSTIPWNQNEAAWLNPPWKRIRPWAKKCSEGTESQVWDATHETELWMPGIPIFSLFPAGVGSDWFSDYVLGQAAVYCISPRPTYLDPRTGLPFVSKQTGKSQTGLNDCLLVDWNCTKNDVGVYAWKWREKVSRKGVKRGPRKPKVVLQELVEETEKLGLYPPVHCSRCTGVEHLPNTHCPGTAATSIDLMAALTASLAAGMPSDTLLPPQVTGDSPVPAAVVLPSLTETYKFSLPDNAPREHIIEILKNAAAAHGTPLPKLVKKVQAGDWPGSELEVMVNRCVSLLGDDNILDEEDE